MYIYIHICVYIYIYIYAGRARSDKTKQKGWGTLELGGLQENGVNLQCKKKLMMITVKWSTIFTYFYIRYLIYQSITSF